MFNRSILGAILALTVAGVGSPAQPVEGDLVFTAVLANRGIFHAGPNGVTPLATMNVGPQSIRMQHGNGALYALRSTAVLSVLGGGQYSTLTALPPGANASGFELDQDGSWIVATTGGTLYRMQGTTFSTLALSSRHWNAITRDLDTGDFFLGDFATGRLVRVDRVTGAETVLAGLLGQNTITGMCQHPWNGNLFVTRLNVRSGLYIRFPSGLAKQVGVANANCVKIDHRSGRAVIGTTDGRVVETDENGTVVNTRNLGSYYITGLEVWGRDHVSSLTHDVGGQLLVDLKLRFANAAGKPYTCAASFGIRPGIDTAWGRLNLAADPLYTLTAGTDVPGLTNLFSGITSAGTGLALAKMWVPTDVPVGTPIYFAATAVGGRRISTLEISDTICVKMPQLGP